jgi:hypothetical protein
MAFSRKNLLVYHISELSKKYFILYKSENIILLCSYIRGKIKQKTSWNERGTFFYTLKGIKKSSERKCILFLENIFKIFVSVIFRERNISFMRLPPRGNKILLYPCVENLLIHEDNRYTIHSWVLLEYSIIYLRIYETLEGV